MTVPIRSLCRDEASTIRAGGQGDNWHTTWAQDDRQYTGLCDGKGWSNLPGYTGEDDNSRIYAIQGDPPTFSFEPLPGYPRLINEWGTPRCSRYYGFGILARGRDLYHFLSTPNRPFDQPSPRFMGVKLIHSPDLGRTWHNQDGGPVGWEAWEARSRANMLFWEEPGDAFSLLTVLQRGRNDSERDDGYVYLYAPNGNAEGTMNQLVLARVPADRVRDRTAYRFYAGDRSGDTAAWSEAIADRAPVCVFPPGWVNTEVHPYAWHPSVVYFAPRSCYLMANWGMGCTPAGRWFGKPSYLGFWTAPRPWGPWTQVHEETAWMPGGDVLARAYQPQILPKWIAPDGRSFWLVWTDFQHIDQKGRIYYAFNTQRVDVAF